LADIVSADKRSDMMRRVKQRRTPPELRVASLLRELGVRYRLNNRRLPGSPDFSNQASGWAIFVNGCFWHGHKNCAKTKSGTRSRVPVQNRRFWRAKIADNRRRDARKCWQLRRLGLRVAIVWECSLRDVEVLRLRLARFVSRASGI
jgi:DNA mismatch endonuclease (patch repair protein)